MSSSDPETTTDPPVDVLRDRVLTISTPERVSVEFPLAGLGSRFGALALDGVVIVVGLMAFATGLFSLQRMVGSEILSPFLAGALLMAVFVGALWGYFFAFEAFRDGQTPGKRAFAIRTVLEGGHPVTVQAAAIRNLIRLIDLQPGISALVGGFVMLVDSRGRRLGDLAAGTVVVRELPIRFPDVPEVGESSGAPRLDDAGFAALESFVDRADELQPAVRAQLGRRLSRAVARLDAKQPGESIGGHLERFYGDERSRRAGARLATEAGTPAALSLLRAKRERWESLRRQLPRLRRGGLRQVGEDEVAEFAGLYREVSADLARSRTYGASVRTVFALERLVGSGHNIFYRPRGESIGRFWRFISGGFSRLFRRLGLPIGISGLLLVGSTSLGFALVVGDPELERMLVSAEMVARADRAVADPNADYRDTWDSMWMGSDAFSVLLVANNVRVALLCFAAGLLLGLGSAWMIVFNGLSFGTALGVFANRGVLDNIGLFVLPHGVIELTAIVIAGGAGLWMGSGVWFPGRRTRIQATMVRARESVGLMAGVVVLLVIAGLIEGFISPSRLPVAAKVAAAAGAAIGVFSYLAFAGRAGDGEAAVADGEARESSAGEDSAAEGSVRASAAT